MRTKTLLELGFSIHSIGLALIAEGTSRARRDQRQERRNTSLAGSKRERRVLLRQFRGIESEVARKCGVSRQHVCKVAYGISKSHRIGAAIEAALAKRISERRRNGVPPTAAQGPSAERKFYHGGLAGLAAILPSSSTGLKANGGRVYRENRVYVTTDLPFARRMARLLQGLTEAAIYEVEPQGELEPDPNHPNISFTCASAKILREYPIR